jgi:hypothetical protein
VAVGGLIKRYKKIVKNKGKLSPFFDFKTPKNSNKKPGIAMVCP